MSHCYFRRLLLLLPLSLLFSGIAHSQSLPPNIDFSLGTFSNWSCFTGTSLPGTAATGPAFSAPILSGPVTGRHTITGGTYTDPNIGLPLVAPASLDSFSAKVGNSFVGAEADRIRYYIHVPAGTTRFSLQTQFMVILEEPGHPAEEQPTFQVVAYDSASGAIIPAANNLYVSGYSIPGFLAHPASPIVYLPWTSAPST